MEWIWDIPSDWQVKRFRRVFRESHEVNGREPVGPMLSISSYHGVQVKEYASENLQRDDDQLETYRVVRPSQLAVNTMWLNHGGLGVSEITGHMSPAYRSYWIGDGFYPKYVHHLMRSKIYVIGYTALLTGIRPNSLQMSRENLMGFPILCPPMEEQRRIADFLDRETAKIDALIAKQEQLITTLDERRGAVLRTLVTRGYREDVALKPASAPWLYGALIPAHWVEAPLSTFLTLKSGSSITSESIEEEGDYPVFGGGGFRGYTDTFTNEGDFVLIGRVGALCGNIKRATGKFYASEHSLVSYPKVPMSQGWLAAILETMNVGQYSKASAQPVISVGGIGRVKAPFPPHEEQLAIDSKLQEAIASIEALSVRTAATVALLKERRQGLISAAVTGKLEVVV